MPGCLSYIVAKDSAEENALWITEAWDSQASHDASLSLRQVQEAIPRARFIVANFEKFATTIPVWGTGMQP
jgi:quinol monooxygenase YgiN